LDRARRVNDGYAVASDDRTRQARVGMYAPVGSDRLEADEASWKLGKLDAARPIDAGPVLADSGMSGSDGPSPLADALQNSAVYPGSGVLALQPDSTTQNTNAMSIEALMVKAYTDRIQSTHDMSFDELKSRDGKERILTERNLAYINYLADYDPATDPSVGGPGYTPDIEYITRRYHEEYFPELENPGVEDIRTAMVSLFDSFGYEGDGPMRLLYVPEGASAGDTEISLFRASGRLMSDETMAMNLHAIDKTTSDGGNAFINMTQGYLESSRNLAAINTEDRLTDDYAAFSGDWIKQLVSGEGNPIVDGLTLPGAVLNWMGATAVAELGNAIQTLNNEFAPKDARDKAGATLVFEAAMSAAPILKAGQKGIDGLSTAAKALNNKGIGLKWPVSINKEAMYRMYSNPIDVYKIESPIVRKGGARANDLSPQYGIPPVGRAENSLERMLKREFNRDVDYSGLSPHQLKVKQLSTRAEIDSAKRVINSSSTKPNGLQVFGDQNFDDFLDVSRLNLPPNIKPKLPEGFVEMNNGQLRVFEVKNRSSFDFDKTVQKFKDFDNALITPQRPGRFDVFVPKSQFNNYVSNPQAFGLGSQSKIRIVDRQIFNGDIPYLVNNKPLYLSIFD